MSEMLSEEIKKFLPHRYPFLLVDRVTECIPGEALTAIKNVTVNEPFFQGHFPQRAIMPGVLIIEALAQATGLLGFRTMSEIARDDLLYMLQRSGIDTGISLSKIVQTTEWLTAQLGRELPALVPKAGIFPDNLRPAT